MIKAFGVIEAKC